MKKRTITIILGICILTLLLIISGSAAYYCSHHITSIRFVLYNAGYLTPGNYQKSELVIDVKGTKVPVKVYRHNTAKSDKYFLVLHGLTPQAYNHPRVLQLASSICSATGMNVLVPSVNVQIAGEKMDNTFNHIAAIYESLIKNFPGRYRAFSACIGANVLLVALTRVSDYLFPEKIFLLGPFLDGKTLFKYYNNPEKSDNIDIVVRLATTLNMKDFNEAEKELIRKAIDASKPGTTDRGEMRRILGDRLYDKITLSKLRHEDFEKIGPQNMFPQKKQNCKFFIMHSKNDKIIPFTIGKSLADFMKMNGMNVTFVGTEYIDHSSFRLSPYGFITEMKQMIEFFDDLFEGDIEI